MMELGRNSSNRISKKRKAENTDNERLSKRLGLLNLERNGQKLYVPVEAASSASSTLSVAPTSIAQTTSPPRRPRSTPVRPDDAKDTMQLDDTKHKVYIYDLDAELSDSETSDDGKLVFLPDISKHLRETRIPPTVFANKEGELAGMSKEMVLYNIPSSLTVPEEQDSVRKAIIEARARARAKLGGKVEQEDEEAGKIDSKTSNFNPWVASKPMHGESGGSAWSSEDITDVEPFPSVWEPTLEDDPDAMDLG